MKNLFVLIEIYFIINGEKNIHFLHCTRQLYCEIIISLYPGTLFFSNKNEWKKRACKCMKHTTHTHTHTLTTERALASNMFPLTRTLHVLHTILQALYIGTRADCCIKSENLSDHLVQSSHLFQSFQKLPSLLLFRNRCIYAYVLFLWLCFVQYF